MKYNFNNISSSDYLNLVNQEHNSDLDELKIQYWRLGTGYFAAAESKYGRIITRMYDRGRELTDEELDALEKYFDEESENMKAHFEKMKDKQIRPNLLSF